MTLYFSEGMECTWFTRAGLELAQWHKISSPGEGPGAVHGSPLGGLHINQRLLKNNDGFTDSIKKVTNPSVVAAPFTGRLVRRRAFIFS